LLGLRAATKNKIGPFELFWKGLMFLQHRCRCRQGTTRQSINLDILEMSLLSSLPDALLSSLLSGWLAITDVVRLDSAICSSALRGEFERVAYKSQTVLSVTGTFETLKRRGTEKMDEWIFIKGLQVDGFYASDYFLETHNARSDYLTKHGRNVKWIRYEANFRADPNDVAKYRLSVLDIAKHCPNLERLVVKHCLNEEILLKVFRCCPLLEELSVQMKTCTSKIVLELAESCSRLRRVSLPDTNVDEESVIALVRGNRNLQHLEVGTTGTAIVRELALNCRELLDLSLHNQTFHLSDVYDLLAQCRRLCRIHFLSCTILPAPKRSSTSVSMQSFTFEHTNVVEAELGDLLQSCPCLKSLTVVCCAELENLETLALGTLCPTLEGLYLGSNGSTIGDDALINISEHCRNLRSLTVAESPSVTDVGLTAVVRHCPHLRSLDASDCDHVTDALLAEVALHCRSLQTLDVSGCGEISESGIALVREGCLQIERLRVRTDDYGWFLATLPVY
jgi:hypothetical protein